MILICACLVLRGPPPFRWSTAAIAVLCFLVAATFYWTLGVVCLAIWFVTFPLQLFRRFR